MKAQMPVASREKYKTIEAAIYKFLERERFLLNIRHCSKCAELTQLSLSHSPGPLGVLTPASRWAESDFISTNKHPNYVIMG